MYTPRSPIPPVLPDFIQTRLVELPIGFHYVIIEFFLPCNNFFEFPIRQIKRLSNVIISLTTLCKCYRHHNS